jgi:hypothetical protein
MSSWGTSVIKKFMVFGVRLVSGIGSRPPTYPFITRKSAMIAA